MTEKNDLEMLEELVNRGISLQRESKNTKKPLYALTKQLV